MEPSFILSGTNLGLYDTRLIRLKKWLGQLQNMPGADPNNDPNIYDARRITLVKILRSWNGIVALAPGNVELEAGGSLLLESGGKIKLEGSI